MADFACRKGAIECVTRVGLRAALQTACEWKDTVAVDCYPSQSIGEADEKENHATLGSEQADLSSDLEG